jgi:glycosyltransferase involved in cell wall biosynthesis
MRAVHLNLVRDSERRTGAQLLDAWPTLASVATAVKGAGAEVAVVQSSHKDETYERDGISYHFVTEPWFGVLASGCSPNRIVPVIKALDPDVIHVNGLGFPFHTRAVCTLDLPVVAQDHANHPRRLTRQLRRWGLANLSGVTFTASEQAVPFFEDGSLKPRLPVFAIPESSTHFGEGDSEQARRVTGLHGSPAVLWVGHLDENKDPITILEAFCLALPRLPNAHLWYCYRNAPMLDRVRALLVREPRVSAQVHFLGAVPHAHVELLCRAADFFVLASKRESCGYALLEAIACGATPIVSDIPAFRAITANGTIGALCKPGDARAFAEALVSLSESLNRDLRTKAVFHFKSELSFPILGRKLVAAYQTLIDQHANPKRNALQ